MTLVALINLEIYGSDLKPGLMCRFADFVKKNVDGGCAHRLKSDRIHIGMFMLTFIIRNQNAFQEKNCFFAIRFKCSVSNL